MGLTQVKQEVEQRIHQKEEEFASTKKNFAKAIEGMQAALETETKGKVEALRMKKKLETDVCDLETALEHANAANMESQKNIKIVQNRLREVQAKMSEEKAQRAMVDAARLADELRGEQEAAMMIERDRKLLEAQVKDASARLDEAEQNALKGGKKAIAKMETRIRELESEFDAESRRNGDAQKNLRKSERRVKKLTYQQDEDKKKHERMQGLIDQLQGKIKSYKKQIEEAEEIAALNLAKFRQTQSNLAECAERCDLNEQALAKMRAKGRGSSMGPM